MKKILGIMAVFLTVVLMAGACGGSSSSFDKLDETITTFLADYGYAVTPYLSLSDNPYRFVATIPENEDSRRILLKDVLSHIVEIAIDLETKEILYVNLRPPKETEEILKKINFLELESVGYFVPGGSVVEVHWIITGYGDFFSYAILGQDGQLTFDGLLNTLLFHIQATPRLVDDDKLDELLGEATK